MGAFFKMMTLENWNPTVRTLYVMCLISLWLGATIANVAMIVGVNINFVGLMGISVFVGIELVRAYKGGTATV